jgi:hypothetical protein
MSGQPRTVLELLKSIALRLMSTSDPRRPPDRMRLPRAAGSLLARTIRRADYPNPHDLAQGKVWNTEGVNRWIG